MLVHEANRQENAYFADWAYDAPCKKTAAISSLTMTRIKLRTTAAYAWEPP